MTPKSISYLKKVLCNLPDFRVNSNQIKFLKTVISLYIGDQNQAAS